MPKKNSPDKVDRDQQILSRLSNIEHRVDSIDQTNAFALRAEREKHLGSIKQIFGTSKRRAQIYLAANGRKTVNQIATHLGIKNANNVSAELSFLNEEGLIEILDTSNGRIWGKKRVDATLQISRFLKEHFNLTDDGSERTKKK